MADPFIGEIKIVGFDFAPQGWALCDGAELDINQNAALFSILGTTYGGDGTTKFKLPDIRGRIPVHAGTGADFVSYNLGQKVGTETVALTVETMPMHNHALLASSAATSKSPANSAPAMATANRYATPTTTGNDNTVANPNALASVGGGKAHENRMPYLALLYIIALEGVFPVRP